MHSFKLFHVVNRTETTKTWKMAPTKGKKRINKSVQASTRVTRSRTSAGTSVAHSSVADSNTAGPSGSGAVASSAAGPSVAGAVASSAAGPSGLGVADLSSAGPSGASSNVPGKKISAGKSQPKKKGAGGCAKINTDTMFDHYKNILESFPQQKRILINARIMELFAEFAAELEEERE